eukprot:scaffold1033_cov171-Amphora_coffeaeformis.AAC.3
MASEDWMTGTKYLLYRVRIDTNELWIRKLDTNNPKAILRCCLCCSSTAGPPPRDANDVDGGVIDSDVSCVRTSLGGQATDRHDEGTGRGRAVVLSTTVNSTRRGLRFVCSILTTTFVKSPCS